MGCIYVHHAFAFRLTLSLLAHPLNLFGLGPSVSRSFFVCLYGGLQSLKSFLLLVVHYGCYLSRSRNKFLCLLNLVLTCNVSTSRRACRVACSSILRLASSSCDCKEVKEELFCVYFRFLLMYLPKLLILKYTPLSFVTDNCINKRKDDQSDKKN